MKKFHLNLIPSVVALFIFIGSFFMLSSPILSAGHSISWQPEKIEITTFQGTFQSVQVNFTSKENISDYAFWLVPELQKFISVKTAEFTSIEKDKEYLINLEISIDKNQNPGKYEGTLHVKSGKRTIAKPLPIILIIKEAGTDIIIENITSPSADRIYQDPITNEIYVKDEIIIGFQAGVSEEAKKNIVANLGGKFLGSDADLNIYQIEVSPTSTKTLEQIMTEFRNVPEIKDVYYHQFDRIDTIPNDTKYDSWNENNPGGNNWGQEFIKLPSAWNIETGSASIKIAVVDPGHRRADNTGVRKVDKFGVPPV